MASKTTQKAAMVGPGARQAELAALIEEARRAGLLDGEKSEHFSFRVTAKLVKAAQIATGVSSPTELGLLALAMLAQPDPVAAYLKRTRGVLGPKHALDICTRSSGAERRQTRCHCMVLADPIPGS